MVTIGFAIMGNDLSEPMRTGLNNLRCAMVFLPNNGYLAAMSIWYAAIEFGYKDMIQKDYIDVYYPVLCTCRQDIAFFSNVMTQVTSGVENVDSSSNNFSEFERCE